MFKIEKSKFGSLMNVKLLNNTSGEYISVIPEYGGNVNEIVLNNKGINTSILEGSRDESGLKRKIENSFQNAKLVPFPNRIRDGRYRYEGISYQFPINEKRRHNRIHGFLYNKKLNILGQYIYSDQVSISMGYDYRGDIEGYPFRFDLKITYTLSKNNGFRCTTEVHNTDNQNIPIGDGWHPFFMTGHKVDELLLELPTIQMVELDVNLIPTGKMTTYHKFSIPTKISADEFDSTFYIDNEIENFTTTIYDVENNLKIMVWQESGQGRYSYLQIYIPPHRNSIAIEPMTCNVNAFNNGDGLIILKPKDTFRASYGVSIHERL